MQLSDVQKQTIYQSLKYAKANGIMQNGFTDEALNGHTITVQNRTMQYFASCSYLGLELDERLKQAAIETINAYGTVFSSSRTYLESPHYNILEEKLAQIFGSHVLLAPTSTLGHISWIPLVVGAKDAIINDQQVHRSVYNATLMAQANGTHTEKVKHNNMDLLEERIEALIKKHDKIWYMADGVYSMFGDVAPMQKLYTLLDKYEQFHIYVDDAHGMSWAGKHGNGYVLSQTEYVHPKMCFVTSLCKGFGSAGGPMIFSDKLKKDFIKNLGSTIIFSGPIAPAMLAASIASANIHLTNEIYEKQQRLQKVMKHFVNEALHLNLPLIDDSITPVKFIGVGAETATLLKIAANLQLDGYFVNVSAFPAVPQKFSGIRITLNVNHTPASIEALLRALKHRMLEASINFDLVKETFGIICQ